MCASGLGAFYCSALFLLVLYVGLPKRVLQQPPGEDHESQERMIACIDIEDRNVLESAQDFGTVLAVMNSAVGLPSSRCSRRERLHFTDYDIVTGGAYCQH